MTGFYFSGRPTAIKKKMNHPSRRSTGREGLLRDLRISSADLTRIASSTDILSSLANRDREPNVQSDHEESYRGIPPCFQSGVLRTNCIDCLDHTNIAQYSYGLASLGRQLHALGLTDIPKVDPDSSMAAALMDMYQCMGDALAHQYGGSAAHNTVFTERQGKWKATTQSREFIKSIKRYYSNVYTDGEKQDAINFSQGEPKQLGICLSPIPACREDFLRMKLTSFDKLIERICTSIKNVRLYCEPDQRSGGVAGSSGVAPDAAEIQLKSPNWLIGQRKPEENSPDSKVASGDVNGAKMPLTETILDGFCDLNLLSSPENIDEEDIFSRYLSMTTIDERNGWYGGTLLGDQDENSDIYRHYAELCQGGLWKVPVFSQA